jgi:hypothetical protein
MKEQIGPDFVYMLTASNSAWMKINIGPNHRCLGGANKTK